MLDRVELQENDLKIVKISQVKHFDPQNSRALVHLPSQLATVGRTIFFDGQFFSIVAVGNESQCMRTRDILLGRDVPLQTALNSTIPQPNLDPKDVRIQTLEKELQEEKKKSSMLESHIKTLEPALKRAKMVEEMWANIGMYHAQGSAKLDQQPVIFIIVCLVDIEIFY